jgi:hypothetical protein
VGRLSGALATRQAQGQWVAAQEKACNQQLFVQATLVQGVSVTAAVTAQFVRHSSTGTSSSDTVKRNALHIDC